MAHSTPSDTLSQLLAARNQLTQWNEAVKEQLEPRVKIALIERGMSEPALNALNFHYGTTAEDGVKITLRRDMANRNSDVTERDINIADDYFANGLEGKNGKCGTFMARRGHGHASVMGYAEVNLKAQTIEDVAAAFGIELSYGPDLPRRK